MPVELFLSEANDITTQGKKSFAMNPHWPTTYNCYRFLNIMKHAGAWSDLSVVDENYYPAQSGTFSAAIHTAVQPDHSGTYTATWDGTGSLTVVGAAASGVGSTSAPSWNPGATNAITFTLDGTIGSNTSVQITNGGSGFVTNIQIVNDTYATEYAAGEILLPAIKTAFSGYECLRSLWWCSEPNGNHYDWDTSLPVGSYTYHPRAGANSALPVKVGTPWSVFIRICNDAAANPWLCVPREADDYYIEELATLVRDNLDDGLMPIFEYTNEAWNSDFAAEHCRNEAQLDGWLPATGEHDTGYVQDFSADSVTGASIVSTNVLTEDTSTGEHYVQHTVTTNDTNRRVFVVKIDPASTAAGVRLVWVGGGANAEMTVDLSGPTVISHSGTTARKCQLDRAGNIHLEITLASVSAATGYFRIAAADSGWTASYTGTSKTVIIHSAWIGNAYNGMYSPWYGKRSVVMRDIIETVFSATGRPYRTALGAQIGFIGAEDNYCLAEQWETNTAAGRDLDPRTYVAPGLMHDELAVAPYFGRTNSSGGLVLSLANNRTIWNAYQVAGGYASAPASYEAGKDVLIDDDGAGNLSGLIKDSGDYLKGRMNYFKAVADDYGMDYSSYENGNHIIHAGTVQDPFWNAVADGATASLENTINDSVLSFTILGDVTGSFGSAGVVQIDSEFLTYTARSFDGTRTTFTVSYRGEKLTTAASHTAGATVTSCSIGSLMDGISEMLSYAMWHADCGALWAEQLDHWKSMGARTWCNLTDIMRSNMTVGYFGIQQDVGETNGVKTAIDAWAAANPRWWLNTVNPPRA